MRRAPKEIPPVLLYLSTTSDADIAYMTVEVEPYYQ